MAKEGTDVDYYIGLPLPEDPPPGSVAPVLHSCTQATGSDAIRATRATTGDLIAFGVNAQLVS